MDRALYILPELVFILITEFIFILATVVLILSYLYGFCQEKGCTSGNCYEKIDEYIHSILQMMKILEPSEEDESKSELHGFNFPRIFVYCLTICLLWMVCAAGIVFLDVFLIEVTNSCDPSASRANCFLNTGFNISALYDEPIDCNNLKVLPDNATFICYRYTLNIGGAFGTAGGMISTGLIMLKFFSANYAYAKKKNPICSYILWVCHFAIAIIFILGILLAVTIVPSIREIVLEGSVIVMFQFFNVLISIGATVVVVTAIILIPEEKGKDYEMELKGTKL